MSICSDHLPTFSATPSLFHYLEDLTLPLQSTRECQTERKPKNQVAATQLVVSSTPVTHWHGGQRREIPGIIFITHITLQLKGVGDAWRVIKKNIKNPSNAIEIRTKLHVDLWTVISYKDLIGSMPRARLEALSHPHHNDVAFKEPKLSMAAK
jgi:hypothetical protein